MENSPNLGDPIYTVYKMLMGRSFYLIFKGHGVVAIPDFKSSHDLVLLVNTLNL